MAPSPTTNVKAKAKSKEKKEKAFHPQSRKASQLERVQLRKSKLASVATRQNRKKSAQIDKFVFFYHAIPPEIPAMTLADVHNIVRDVWLKRYDVELETERSTRKKGRPKSSRQVALEDLMLREAEEYRTGLEVPDLTHAPTVALFRRWRQTDVEYVDLLRFIRITSENPDIALVSRPGKHESLTRVQDVEMGDADDPSSKETFGHPIKFASTMQTMDEGPPARPADTSH